MPFPFLPPEERAVFPVEGRTHLPPDTETAFNLCSKVQDFHLKQANCQWSQNAENRKHHQIMAGGATVTAHELRIHQEELYGSK